MATITFSVTAGAINLSQSYTFSDNDAPRLATWAKANYLNFDGSQPNNSVAWARVSLALAKNLLSQVKGYEQQLTISAAQANAATITISDVIE